jgi:hypothetical protein
MSLMPTANTQEWVKQKKTATEAVAEMMVQRQNVIVKKRKEELDMATMKGGSVASAIASPASTRKVSTKSRKKRGRDDGAAKTKAMANNVKSRDPKRSSWVDECWNQRTL